MTAWDKKKGHLLLNATPTTYTMANFVTSVAACSKILIYTASAPSAANKLAATVDVMTFPATGGQTLTWGQIPTAKTATVGSHAFTISAKDWWGNTNDKTLTATVAISDAACETNHATATVTLNDVAAATYTMGGADVAYKYSVTALKPSYCKYTIAAQAVPVTNSFNSHVKIDTKTSSFKLTKFTGAGSLAATYSLKATVTTLHGTALSKSTQIWEKKITVKDPCTLANLKYVAKAPTTGLEYQIGAADFTIMNATAQITQPGGTTTAFCLKRVKAAFTFTGDNSPTSYFKTNHDTTGILIFLNNYTVKDKKEVTVNVQYKLDGTTVLTGIKYSFKVKTKAVCGTPTFTVPAAAATTPKLYVGRTQSIAWPAWTPNPSFCKFAYNVDATTNGGLGKSFSKFTVDATTTKRTVSIKAA